jgi:hypothetical protein
MIDRVPMWFAIQDSLDHIDAKRARSRAPRKPVESEVI